MGDAADITTAMIDTTTLGVVPVHQRYHRIGKHRFHYENLDSQFEVDFDVDPYGLVHDYPNLFRRL